MDDLRDMESAVLDENNHFGDTSEDTDEEDLVVDENQYDDQVGEVGRDNLGISVEQARANIEAAGTEVDEEPERITVQGNEDLINPEVDKILDNIVTDLKMPYKPAQFQRVAINALGDMKNLVLVSPTGSGKMNIPLLATLVLRQRLKNSKGVGIITQPLTSIMKEKQKNPVCKAAILSMSGDLSTSSEKEGYEEDANLSCDLKEVLNGSFPVLFGHPESFDSKLGQYILRELKRLDRIILVCIDEFHQGGEGHWSSFRPNMMKSSTGLRLYGVKGCPTIAMTATATQSEIKDVVVALGLKTKPVILTSSPVQAHIKISIIRRPSNNYGLDGTTSRMGDHQPGTMDLLMRLYLQKYLDDLSKNIAPKKCIIFCRGNSVLGEIYSRLMELTHYRYKDCRDSPFVMNHASLLPPTEEVLSRRSQDISLYLSSNKMLLGIDLPDIDVIIFLRPYNQLAALLQGGGRGGRRMENGKRRRVQVYQLFNSQDFTTQNKQMSPDMKRVCFSKKCTRSLLKEYFVDNSEEQVEEGKVAAGFCCHNCDTLS